MRHLGQTLEKTNVRPVHWDMNKYLSDASLQRKTMISITKVWRVCNIYFDAGFFLGGGIFFFRWHFYWLQLIAKWKRHATVWFVLRSRWYNDILCMYCTWRSADRQSFSLLPRMWTRAKYSIGGRLTLSVLRRKNILRSYFCHGVVVVVTCSYSFAMLHCFPLLV